MVWYGMVWYGMVWYGMVWYGMVWYGMVWYGMVWYGMAGKRLKRVSYIIPVDHKLFCKSSTHCRHKAVYSLQWELHAWSIYMAYMVDKIDRSK